MNKNNSTLIFGAVVALILVGVYVYAIYSYNPSIAQINETANPVATIDVNQISRVTSEIGARQANGSFPINVAAQDSKNPFNNLE